MKHLRYILLLLWFFTKPASTLLAQIKNMDIHTLDSLNNKLQEQLSQSEKTKVLMGLSDYWRGKDSAKTFTYAQQSLQSAQKIDNKFLVALARFYKGNAWMTTHGLDSAEREYLSAQKLLGSIPGKASVYYQARIWNNYGVVFQLRNDNRKYIDILLNSVIPLLENIKDSTMLANTYENIGMLFLNFGEYDKALYYCRHIIGNYKPYLTYDMLAKACLFATRAILFKHPVDFPLAKSYLMQAEEVLRKDPESRVWITFYATKGGYDYFKEDYKQALQNFDTGWALEQKWKTGYEAANLLLGRAEVYYKMNKPQLAKQTIYALTNFTKAYNLNTDQLLLLNKTAFFEAATGNYKNAYHKLSEYITLSDSANITRAKIAMSTLEKKYQTEKKEKEILKLQNKNKQNSYLAYLLTTAMALLLALLGLVYSRYRNKKKSAEQQETFLKQKIQQQEQQQQLKIYDAIMEGQEQERKRLARDLHDGLGGMLAGVKLKLSDIAIKNKINLPDMELYKVINQLDSSVTELRRIARNMMPESLLKFGLETALKDLCTSMQTVDCIINCQLFHIAPQMEQADQIMIYRIIQELLANVLRHAHARNVVVQCSQNENIIFITVEDDGIGFNKDTTKKETGIGLLNIQNRVDLLKGSMDIHSNVTEGGTTINIEVYVG